MQRIGSLRWIALFVISAGIAAVVSRAVANSSTTRNDILQPAVELPRQTTKLSQQVLHPTVQGDGYVVKQGNHYEIYAGIADTDLAYRLSLGHFTVRALIVGGPAGFVCTWAGLRLNQGSPPQMACAIPRNVKVVSGLQASMVVSIGVAKPVEALPLSAVIGGSGQGQVIVVTESHTYTVRRVELGASDSSWVQVTSGLGPGQRVLLNPVQSDLSAQ